LVSEVGSNDINLRCKMVKLRSRALAGRRNIGKFLFQKPEPRQQRGYVDAAEATPFGAEFVPRRGMIRNLI